MKCPRCNIELPDNATFCPQCGNPITSKQIFQPDAENQRQTSSVPLSLIVGLIGFACIVIGTLMFLSTEPDPKEKKTTADPIRAIPMNVAVGSDFNLYGKTLDNEDFDWKSLRGKYVWVKFTATWCVWCRVEIPNMLDVYEKYHDKGLEIISVYIREDELAGDPVERVKQLVKQEKLPWIILSESLTVKAGQPSQKEFFGIQPVPTMLLIDPEGKVLMTEANGDALKSKWAEIFE